MKTTLKVAVGAVVSFLVGCGGAPAPERPDAPVSLAVQLSCSGDQVRDPTAAPHAVSYTRFSYSDGSAASTCKVDDGEGSAMFRAGDPEVDAAPCVVGSATVSVQYVGSTSARVTIVLANLQTLNSIPCTVARE